MTGYRTNCAFTFYERINWADQGCCLPCTSLLYNLHLRFLATRRWKLPAIKLLFNTVTPLYLALALGHTNLNWKENRYVLSNNFNVRRWDITYLLTPWSRVLLEKLTGLQLFKKFPVFHGTRRFITALTSVLQLSLSCATQSSPYTHIPPPGDPS